MAVTHVSTLSVTVELTVKPCQAKTRTVKGQPATGISALRDWPLPRAIPYA